MEKGYKLVVFTLNEQKYALYLSVVERIVRVVEITPLPQAPNIVLGVVNVQGKIIPVLNIRQRFNLPPAEINLNNQLIIANTGKRTVSLVVDEVSEIIEYPELKLISAKDILPEIKYVEGVAKLEDGIVLIHNLDTFLSLEEEAEIDKLLAEQPRIKN